MMSSEPLRELWRARPFRPFRIHLAEGRRLAVRHPEFMTISPTGRTAILYEQGDHFEVIDILMITSLKTTNGEAPRRSGVRRGRK